MNAEDEVIGGTSVGKDIEAKRLTLKMVTDSNSYEFLLGRKEAMGLRDQLIEALVGEPDHEGEAAVGEVVDFEGSATAGASSKA